VHPVVTSVAHQVGQDVTTRRVVTPGDVGDVETVTTHGSGERMAGKRGDGRVVSRAVITARSLAACHQMAISVVTQSAGQHRRHVTTEVDRYTGAG